MPRRDMLSTPPARPMDSMPDMIFMATVLTASRATRTVAMQLGTHGHIIPAGINQRCFRDILALFVYRLACGADKVCHLGSIQLVAGLHLLQQIGYQVNRLYFVQSPTGLAFTPRRTNRVVDVCFFTHWAPL